MRTVPDLPQIRANLEFSCVHEAEHLPALDPEADVLFRYARYLEKQKGPKEYEGVARYYRIAAAYGHYKANNNLQQLVSHGLASSPLAQKESVDLAAQLIDEGVPSGYYDIGYYLKLGYGLKQDQEMSLRYIRKAADLGNANAQFYVAQLLAPMDRAPEIARKMRRCAAEQGHGDAAGWLGIHFQDNGFFTEAMPVFQMGVRAGDMTSASFLEEGFSGHPEGDMYYLGVAADPERARRYSKIRELFRRFDGRNPKVPDIDKIVPLPPAKLPPWDGTFQWQKEQEAAEPPPKPSDELILRLCKAKNLDPATGLPIPPPPKAALGTQANTGTPCPESGTWRATRFSFLQDATGHFRKGETMPALYVPNRRIFDWLDDFLGLRYQDVAVTWKLVAHDKET